MAVIQPRPTHILYQCAKFGDDRTRHFWRVRRLTCKWPIPIFWYFISQLLVEISIWNSYNRVALKKIVFHVKGQGHRAGTLLFEGTVISQKLSHGQFSIFFCIHLFVCPINWNNKNLSEQRNYVTKKYVNIWRLTCKTPIPQLILLIKSSTKI